MLLVALEAAGQVEKSRTLSRSFPVSRQMSVKVSNKYGNVVVNTWDKDSVAFVINIRSVDKKEADAEARLAGIDVKFVASSYFLDVQTTFPENKNVLGVDWQEVTGGIFPSSRRIDIDYEISIPAWANLEIVNRYGNVYASDHNGGFKLSLSNGDFKAGTLLGETTLNVGFGNVTLNQLGNARLELSYAEMVLKNAGKLHIEGRSSKCWITAAESIDLDSRRDKLYVDTVASVSGQCDFSTLQIGYLGNSGMLNAKYGDLKVSTTSALLSMINLNTEYTDVIINLPIGMGYNLSADYRKTLFTVPAETGFQPQLVDEKAQQYHMAGKYQPSGSGDAQLLINAVAGSISLQHIR
jgi:hypothetical protein